MTTPKAQALSAKVNSIKGHQILSESRELLITVDAKYVGDLSLILPLDQLDRLSSLIEQVRAETPTQKNNELKVSAPRSWLVTADLQVHDVVLLIFNQQTQAQVGYALEAEATKKIADALIRNAEAVSKKKAAHKPS
jgi:hypothetical protein